MLPDSLIVAGDARTLTPDLFPYRYGVVVADPPWAYAQWSERKQGAARSVYNLLSTADLCAMPVKDIAKTDSVLLLWGTWPKLPDALQVMAAWGFEYVTGFPWVKLTPSGEGIHYGIGFWVRGCSEFVFIGRRGNVSPPRLEGILGLIAPNLHHSRKPDDVHDIAETLPGPYLELFARRSRLGWTSFGNDIEDMATGHRHRDAGNTANAPVQGRLALAEG